MAEKLFFSQEIINAWTDDARVKFENDKLSIDTPRGHQEYFLTPAYRFLRVSDGSPDLKNLLNSIITQEELAKLGADVYLNSCIIGETPYEVEPGYVAAKADEENINQLLMEYLAKTLI
jgi:hypothetical protein